MSGRKTADCSFSGITYIAVKTGERTHGYNKFHGQVYQVIYFKFTDSPKWSILGWHRYMRGAWKNTICKFPGHQLISDETDEPNNLHGKVTFTEGRKFSNYL